MISIKILCCITICLYIFIFMPTYLAYKDINTGFKLCLDIVRKNNINLNCDKYFNTFDTYYLNDPIIISIYLILLSTLAYLSFD